MTVQHIQCKACFAHGEKDVRVEDRELHLGEHDVLVKVERGGICGSDIHYYFHGRAGMSILKNPMVIGHEFAGIVEQAPKDSGLAIGQRVAVNPSQPCNCCPMCLSGKQNQCPTMKFMGSAQFNPHVNGGFSEYIVASVAQCIPYANHVSPKIMAFSEPLAVAIHAVNIAGSLVGKRVLVTGSGPIGCLIMAAALNSGASEIVATDMSERCRELAIEMGASLALDPTDEKAVGQYKENKGYFDVVFEASGAASAVASTVEFTKPTGTVVQVGMGASPVNYPLSLMLVKEINFVGSFRFVHEFETAVKWLESGRINPLPLLSSEFSKEDIVNALEFAADKNKAAKVQVYFD